MTKQERDMILYGKTSEAMIDLSEGDFIEKAFILQTPLPDEECLVCSGVIKPNVEGRYVVGEHSFHLSCWEETIKLSPIYWC
jgi:hypothetical protein